MASRPAATGAIIITLMLGGMAVYWFSSDKTEAGSADPVVVPTVTPTATSDSEPDEVPPSKRHLKRSNLRMLHSVDKPPAVLVMPKGAARPGEEPSAK